MGKVGAVSKIDCFFDNSDSLPANRIFRCGKLLSV